MQRTRAFSLIELMIALAIAAVLMAIATATYQRYVLRSSRVEAQHLLMKIAHAEERWYATYNRYTEDLDQLGFDDSHALSPRAHYALSLSIEDAAAQSYAATALPINAQAGDACGILVIDQSGHRTSAHDGDDADAHGPCW